MANQEQLDILKQGVGTWNTWRQEHQGIRPDFTGANLMGANLVGVYLMGADLMGADLSGAYLSGANLSGANLSGANLTRTHLIKGVNLNGAVLRGAILRNTYAVVANLKGADLRDADLSGAVLRSANLSGANLSKANLSKANLSVSHLNAAHLSGAVLQDADLSGAILSGAILSGAIFSGADLSGADLRRAILIGTIFERANLTGASIYGISAWNLQLKDAKQCDLVITDKGKPIITVDNLEMAQFIYLLLNNERIRQVIDTITSKVVLILGRFTPERKAVLDTLREELRKQDYLPVLFDFEKPRDRDFTETIITLAHLARFMIADLTEPNSIPHEVATIIPQCKVPIQPLLIQSASIREYSMFRDLMLYPWVLPTFRYQDTMSLLVSLKEHVIEPAERKAKELAQLKTETL
jgi:uncharacterized protein YjbI with pentapeptide repeats